MSLLLDTGVLHACLATRDRLHEPAMAIMANIADGLHGQAVTTTFVLDEALTLLRARRGSIDSREVLLGLVGLSEDAGVPHVAHMLDVTREDLSTIVQLQRRHWDRGLSFTDCSSLHVMQREGIDAIATFDKAFEGLVPVVPDS